MAIVSKIITNRCPSCEKGEVFRGFFAMHANCPECQFKFEREPGYFLGAMLASYFIGVFSIVPTVVICLFILKIEIIPTVAIAVAQVILFQPFLYRYSRLTWLHVEQRMSRTLAKR